MGEKRAVKGLKSLNMEKVWTPCWAARQLPETVELIKIRGRWYMLLWTDTDVVSQLDPEQWAYCNGELGDSVELELWIPPTRLVADLVRDIVEDLDKEAEEKARSEKREAKHERNNDGSG